MNTRATLTLLLAIATGGLAHPAGAQDPATQPSEYQGIPYITGGIGQEEREQLFFAAPEYNLKLLFAEKGGSYTADTEIQVTRPDGRKVLELIAGGPLVYARLPAGNYRISVTANGREQVRSTSVPATGQRALVFYW